MTVPQERPDPKIEIREEDLSEADRKILEVVRDEAEALFYEEETRAKETGRFKDAGTGGRPELFDRKSVDMEIARLWAATNDGSISEEALRDFNHRKREEVITPSQKGVWSLLNNRAAVVIGRRQLRERKMQ